MAIVALIILVVLFAIQQIHTPKISISEIEKNNPRIEQQTSSDKKIVYYGVPLVIHPSYRYYKFSRYDPEKHKVLNPNLVDSSFWAETDYADVSRTENGKRVFSNKWIALIDDNPNAVFKITGKIQKDKCLERLDNPILSKEFCAKDAPEFALVIYDIEVIK